MQNGQEKSYEWTTRIDKSDKVSDSFTNVQLGEIKFVYSFNDDTTYGPSFVHQMLEDILIVRKKGTKQS